MAKSKTFEIETDFGDLVQWVIDTIETEEHEVIESGASPSMDVITITKHKYKITIEIK